MSVDYGVQMFRDIVNTNGGVDAVLANATPEDRIAFSFVLGWMHPSVTNTMREKYLEEMQWADLPLCGDLTHDHSGSSCQGPKHMAPEEHNLFQCSHSACVADAERARTEPNLGLATTRELLEELKARGEALMAEDKNGRTPRGADGMAYASVAGALLRSSRRDTMDVRGNE